MTRKQASMPSHFEFRANLGYAHELGTDLNEMDESQLAQSAEYANDILPNLREMSGYTDRGPGTFWGIPKIRGMTEDQVADELELNFGELLESFWDGQGTGEVPEDEDEDEDEGDE